jgi:hypothetical protein
MDTRQIKNMSRAERLLTMEVLWDSLVEEEPQIESPSWHRDVLEERKGKIESGQAEFISLEKLRASRKS